ncbi:core protein precursor pVII [Crane-associated adenovirus 1]|uniref:Core protein pVII n=1 Tax=Crane-associated adenovirus 1 TaxID=2559941 RepID=A0A5H2WVZ2_9ADEN|nr:core protein precursor pVII [Crane-associated adenovirus 1]
MSILVSPSDNRGWGVRRCRRGIRGVGCRRGLTLRGLLGMGARRRVRRSRARRRAPPVSRTTLVAVRSTRRRRR